MEGAWAWTAQTPALRRAHRSSRRQEHDRRRRGGSLRGLAPTAHTRIDEETTMIRRPIPTSELRAGVIYQVWSRNLRLAAYDGHRGLFGIREKFQTRYLFTEERF
jgi:hypothetical protein